jgi:hypothetical protein
LNSVHECSEGQSHPHDMDQSSVQAPDLIYDALV